MFRPLVACFFVVAFGQFLEVQARLKAAVEEVSDLLDSAKKDLKEKYEHAEKKGAELQEFANAHLPASNLLNHMVKRAAVLENVDPKTREFLKCLSAHTNIMDTKQLEELLSIINQNLPDLQFGIPANKDRQVVYDKNVQTGAKLMAKKMGLEQPTPEQMEKAKEIAKVLPCINDAELLKELLSVIEQLLPPLKVGASNLESGASNLESLLPPLKVGASNLESGASNLESGASNLESLLPPLKVGASNLNLADKRKNLADKRKLLPPLKV